MSIADVNALLTAPGSVLEMETVAIHGRPTRTWKNAPPTLRDVFIAGRGHGEEAYLAPLVTSLKAGRVQADRWIELYKGEWAGSLAPIYEAASF